MDSEKDALKIVEQTVVKKKTISPMHQAPDGTTPLHTLAALPSSRKCARIAKKLLAMGASIDVKCNVGRTPLNYAVVANNVRVAKVLIDKGADPNENLEQGVTLLHISASQGTHDLAKVLCKAGANPNAVAQNGDTPKMTAAKKNDTKMFSILNIIGDSKFDDDQLDRKALMMLTLNR